MKKGKISLYSRRFKKVLVSIFTLAIMSCLLWNRIEEVHAEYIFFMTEAYQGGTVTIVPKMGREANGYYELAGYQVTYSVTNDAWKAFNANEGGYFYVGNDLKPDGGCSFGYAPSGTVQQGGAIQLGCLADGRVIGRCDALTDTVSYTFDVANLSELPKYIAYSYEPASYAYLHLSQEMGNTHHIWYYQSLQDAPVTNIPQIDTDNPILETSVQPVGTSVVTNGITWAQKKEIVVTAKDAKSGVGTVSIYQDGALKKEEKITGYFQEKQVRLQVAGNGTYEAETYDNIGNASGKKTIVINGVDNEGPVIKKLSQKNTAYCTENMISVESNDSGAGLATYAYSWNGGAWTNQKTLKVTKNGTYTVVVRDALGNQSTKSIKISNIDKNPPVIEKMETGNTEFCKTNTIVVSAIDKEAGLDEFPYSWEQDVWTNEAEFSVSTNGKYTVTVKDKLGNKTQKSIVVINIDNDAPIIEKCEECVDKAGKVTVEVTASDGQLGVGLADKAYSFDDGKTWQESPIFAVEKNGSYTVVVRDALDNRGSEVIKITRVIEKKEEIPDEKEEDSKEKENIDKDESDKNKVPIPNVTLPDIILPDITVSENKIQIPEQTDNANHNHHVAIVPGNHQPVSIEETNIEDIKEKDDENEIINEDRKGNEYVKKQKRKTTEQQITVDSEKLLSEREDDGEILELKPVKQSKVKTVTLAVLTILMVAGVLCFLLYLLLFCLQHTCILYGVNDKQERIRIGRLPIHRFDTEWKVKVPDARLGDHGTGRYILVFHPTFVKEEMPTSVVIVIAERSIREILDEEVTFCI
ncbi:MAG: hypothetical protein IJZ44_06615 [Lachnospiraceae bacterium]|nr:hypothetical protein [Lachnospiraceae bacterium]